MKRMLILLFAAVSGLALLQAQSTNAAPAAVTGTAVSTSTTTATGPAFAPSPPPANWASIPAEAPPGAAPAATNAVAAAPSAPAVPKWKPGDPLPAEPNWKWMTADGKEYDNVVITGIDSSTVSFTHSFGVAHLDIASLPPEVQQRLGYDPAAAAAAQKEKQREDEHPYFRYAELAEAQATARQLHRPLAWICGSLSALSAPDANPGSEDEITQMSVDYLKSRAVTVFMDGGNDYGKSPPAVMAQFNQLDDGPIPGGHHFYVPKIVFTDADVKLQLGRAWYGEMKDGRDAIINAVLQGIANDPTAQAALNGPAPAP